MVYVYVSVDLLKYSQSQSKDMVKEFVLSVDKIPLCLTVFTINFFLVSIFLTDCLHLPFHPCVYHLIDKFKA